MLKLKGCFTALVTPFRNGRPDIAAFRRIVRAQLAGGVDGLVPCGTTGEAATLSPAEYAAVVRAAVEEAGGRVPVVPGAGTNSTARSVEMVKAAASLGADGALAVVPYYNKPPQAGIFAHFSAMASAGLPLVLYNIPGRTGVNMLPDTVLALRKRFQNIVGIKEASGSLEQAVEIMKRADGGFSVMSGDDSLAFPMMAAGASGVVSVAGNVAPAEMAGLCRLMLAGGTKEAKAIHRRLSGLMKILFVETNPIPVKYAMHLLGYCSPETRLPLTTLAPAYRALLKKVMREAGLLNRLKGKRTG